MGNAPYTSDALYHFVGRGSLGDDEKTFRILLNVLEGRCVSHPPHQVGWGVESLTISPEFSIIGDKLVAPNIVCFCDIPLQSMEIHHSKYGRFGVGIDRSYLAQHGCRPVMYFPYAPSDWGKAYGRCLIEDIEATYRALYRVADEEDVEEYSRSMGEVPEHALMSCIEGAFSKDFLAFVKAYDYTLPKEHADCFYMEREWRRIGNVMFTEESLRKVVVPLVFRDRLLDRMPWLESKIVLLE
ncbi:abortive infection system antitoxin AbiGi family protein [Pseudomonas sp. JG-B]|uniref:abortive infection system antitoxin AbiGi family protein n=1 Tax=Pseudomonas sp. JG-B TaxID=2603214 RepID=UPI0015B772E6|nr:abortive infection system antitoxin AbiGi family protein [Pseudomonas sp. JG-B]